MENKQWLASGEGTLLHPLTLNPIKTEVIELKGWGRIGEWYDYSDTPKENKELILAAPKMARLLERILGMHDTNNCGAYNGEAVLSESVADEIRHILPKRKGKR